MAGQMGHEVPDDLPEHATPVDDPTGIDVGRVTAWLVDHLARLVPPLSFARLPGGHSNFTYRVHDATGRAFVVRRPPLGELLPSAHDMGREYRVMHALWPTRVPVPEPLAACADLSVTGAPFYAMGSVRGRSLYTRADVEALVPEDRRGALARSFIDALAELHALDPATIGLGDLGRPDAYVARQLRRWHQSWEASKTTDLPVVDELHAFLAERCPAQARTCVVHGDFGLHNTIATPEGEVGAVVDWEISTLGDPLADLSYALNAWSGPGDEHPIRPEAPSTAPGFPDRAELLARYADSTGFDVGDIGFYVAFNHWKSVCIVDGVCARYLQGQKSTEGVDLAGLIDWRDRSLARGVEAARALGFSR